MTNRPGPVDGVAESAPSFSGYTSPCEQVIQAVATRPDEEQTGEQPGVLHRMSRRPLARDDVVCRSHNHHDQDRQRSRAKKQTQSDQEAAEPFRQSGCKSPPFEPELDAEIGYRLARTAPTFASGAELWQTMVPEKADAEAQPGDKQATVAMTIKRGKIVHLQEYIFDTGETFRAFWGMRQ